MVRCAGSSPAMRGVGSPMVPYSAPVLKRGKAGSGSLQGPSATALAWGAGEDEGPVERKQMGQDGLRNVLRTINAAKDPAYRKASLTVNGHCYRR